MRNTHNKEMFSMASKKRYEKQHYRKTRFRHTRPVEMEHEDTEDYYTYYKQGLFWSKDRECDLAIERFNQVIRLNPTFANAFFERGFMYYYRCAFQGGDESDLELALNDFDQALQLDPLNINTYDYRIMTNNRRHQYNEVIADCKTVIQHWPNAHQGQFFKDMADAYQKQGDYDKAIETLTEALRYYPEYYAARSRAYLQKGDYDAALADALRMVELSPNYSHAYVTCGDAYYAKGEITEAINAYQTALNLEPRLTEIQHKLTELLRQNDI